MRETLLRTAERASNNFADAEDALQDAMLRLLSMPVAGVDNPGGYLRVMVRHSATALVLKRTPSSVPLQHFDPNRWYVSQQNKPHRVPPPLTDSIDIEALDTDAVVERALKILSPKQKMAMALYLAGHKTHEIAKLMGLSFEATAAHLLRAKKALRARPKALRRHAC